MSEIAEIREAQRHGAPAQQHIRPMKLRRARDIGAKPDEAGERGGEQRAAAGEQDRRAPVQPAESGGEMGRGGAERQRADEQADQQAKIAARPGRGHGHADRIDAGEAHSGDEAQDGRDRRGRRQQRRRSGAERGGQSRKPEQKPLVETVRQGQQRGNEGADDEAGLNAAGEQRREKRTQRLLRLDRRDRGVGGEPAGHGRDLAQQQDRERPRATRHFARSCPLPARPKPSSLMAVIFLS